MAKLQSLKCPQCGGEKFTEISWDRRECRHCGSILTFSQDRVLLELAERICPSCQANNEATDRFCQQCGRALTRTCPVCGYESFIGARFCGHCGFDYTGKSSPEAGQPSVEPERESGRLYLSYTDRVIAGVCGGIAQYYQVDANWVRLAFGLSILLSGLGILVYIILWIALPEEPVAG